MRVKIFQLLEKWRKYIYMEELQKLLNNHPEVHVKKFYNLKWVLVVFCSKQYTRVSKRNCYTVSYARSPKQLNADHDFAQFFFFTFGQCHLCCGEEAEMFTIGSIIRPYHRGFTHHQEASEFS